MPSAARGAGPYPYPVVQERKRRTWLVFLVIGIVLVLAVGTSAVGYWVSHRTTDTFPVGSCVTQQGDDAVPAACGPGKYRVVKEVSDRSRCPDPNGPAVDLQGGAKADVRCLEAVR